MVGVSHTRRSSVLLLLEELVALEENSGFLFLTTLGRTRHIGMGLILANRFF